MREHERVWLYPLLSSLSLTISHTHTQVVVWGAPVDYTPLAQPARSTRRGISGYRRTHTHTHTRTQTGRRVQCLKDTRKEGGEREREREREY